MNKLRAAVKDGYLRDMQSNAAIAVDDQRLKRVAKTTWYGGWVWLGEGVVIRPHARFSGGNELHDDCYIGDRARLGHEVKVGYMARVRDGSRINDGSIIGTYAIVGAGAIVGPHMSVPAYAEVGQNRAILDSMMIHVIPHIVGKLSLTMYGTAEGARLHIGGQELEWESFSAQYGQKLRLSMAAIRGYSRNAQENFDRRREDVDAMVREAARPMN